MQFDHLLKQAGVLLGILAFVYAGSWAWRWYQGKTAPSKSDTAAIQSGSAIAYFAGGCFWCVESDYEKLPEVLDVVSGYMGGAEENPSYREVASGVTKHRESVKVVYDPERTTYRELVLHLLRHTDPTDEGGSFYDRGRQYTSAVFYQTDEERKIAEGVIADLEARRVFGKPIATSVEPAGTFWVAEDYHQDYYKKNPLQYQHYRTGSGRDAFTDSVWKSGKFDDLFTEEGAEGESQNSARSRDRWSEYRKPNEETLRKTLTPLQYEVSQREGTETPFQNEYWNNHEEGIYVDIVSGEPLFSSADKFDSGTGWPSFLRPLDPSFVTEHTDYKLIIPRTEIRSRYADSHLGHIILDGPPENDRVRYCMNSAALRFVPKDMLDEEGLSEYLYLFK